MAKFPLGQQVVTRGVYDHIETDPAFALFVKQSMDRHAKGDWGDLCAEDKALNDESLNGEGRLFSAYEQAGLPKIWIITEWDRSVTTVLFPDEY